RRRSGPGATDSQQSARECSEIHAAAWRHPDHGWRGRSARPRVVRDNGVGIPKDAQAAIFDLFTRATTDGGGFGIGLAIVRRLVEAHGGSIAVVSGGVGHGTEFIVTLPRTHR